MFGVTFWRFQLKGGGFVARDVVRTFYPLTEINKAAAVAAKRSPLSLIGPLHGLCAGGAIYNHGVIYTIGC